MPESLDGQILEFLKEANPSGAYLFGFNDYAGKLFVASKENVDAALRRARGLRAMAKTNLQRKILDSVETTLLFEEHQTGLDDIIDTILSHLGTEGVNDDHMI